MNQYEMTRDGYPTPRRPEYHISIPLYLILTIITFGIFNLYWNYRQMGICNDLLERYEFSFWAWILFSLITCGIYHIYYQYKMGAAIMEIQKDYNAVIFDKLPLISVFGTIFGFSIVVDCVHQYELNKVVG